MLKEKCEELIQSAKDTISSGKKRQRKGFMIGCVGSLLTGIGAGILYIGGLHEGVGRMEQAVGEATRDGVKSLKDDIKEDEE